MDYMLTNEKAPPKFRRFDDPDDAIKEAEVLALSEGDTTIWQALGKMCLKPQYIDLTIPVVPEPPRRGRPRKTATPPETPATPPGIIFDSSPYHDGVYRGPFYGNEKLAAPAALLIDSYGCERDPDGIYRACILYTRDGRTVNSIGIHEDSEIEATWNALVDVGIMSITDLEALPDSEGKRQVLAALGAKATD